VVETRDRQATTAVACQIGWLTAPRSCVEFFLSSAITADGEVGHTVARGRPAIRGPITTGGVGVSSQVPDAPPGPGV
jgi:hypothetical protein